MKNYDYVKDLLLRRLNKYISNNTIHAIYVKLTDEHYDVFIELAANVVDTQHNYGRAFILVFDDVDKLSLSTYKYGWYFRRRDHLLIYNADER